MIPEDRRQAQARTRAAERKRKTSEQVAVLIAGAVALLGFLMI